MIKQQICKNYSFIMFISPITLITTNLDLLKTHSPKNIQQIQANLVQVTW